MTFPLTGFDYDPEEKIRCLEAELCQVELERDKWKYRAKIMWEEMKKSPGDMLGVMYGDLPDDEPNWFED